MNKRAVIYARVSTDEQVEKGHSIPFQLEECRKYAIRFGFHVVNEITDSKSGSTLERPGFNVLEMILSNGEADAVIVYTSDRLSRNYYDYVPLIGKWQNKNIELHFVDRGQSQNDLQGMISDGIFAMIAHTERLKILERTKNGRLKKAINDKRPVMTGHVPYGYGRTGKFQDAQMFIDETEAAIVQMIFKWYTTFEDGGPFSLMAIANRLDAMGIKPKRSKMWQPTSIRMILTNETYIGCNYYAKTIVLKDGRQVPRPREEWITIPVPHLAIIDPEVFEQAQLRAKQNQEHAKRNRKHDYLLVGHIRCGCCGLAMYGFRKWEGATPYYRCASYHHKNAVCTYQRRSVMMCKADEVVWKWLSSLLMDEMSLMAGIQEMIQTREDDLEPKRERYDYIVKILEASTEKARRLVDELADFDSELIKATVREKIKQLETEQNMLTEEKIRLASELEQFEIPPDTEKKVLEIASKVSSRLPNATFNGMREILELLDVKITFFNTDDSIKLHVTCLLPNSDQDIAFGSS